MASEDAYKGKRDNGTWVEQQSHRSYGTDKSTNATSGYYCTALVLAASEANISGVMDPPNSEVDRKEERLDTIWAQEAQLLSNLQ